MTRYLVLLAPLLCGFSTSRIPTTTSSQKWASPSVTYYVDESGITSMEDDADTSAVYQAFAAWSTQSCSNFNFVDGGLRASDPGTSANFIRFAHSGSGWPVPGAIAYTARLSSGGTITSADIFVNDFSLQWSTSGDLQAFDLQSVITHELGHALGLNHSADPRTTMYFAGQRGNTFFRSLSEDDIKGLCYLYPSSSTPCATTADCPMLDNPGSTANRDATVCNSGTCVVGVRPYGGDCWENGDCGDSGNVCVRYNGTPNIDPGICTRNCACPAGDECADAPGGGTRCAPKATACDSNCDMLTNHICAPNVDGEFTCVQACLLDAHCTEQADDFCYDPIDAGSAGVCRVRGPKANGQPCDAPSECQSLICGSDLQGVTKCVDPDAVVEPPDPPTDTGPTPDGGDPSGGDGGTQDPGPGGGSNSPSGSAKSTDGGCAAVSPSIVLVMGAIVCAFYAVRRTRLVRTPDRP